jgi:anaerobic magnesium-protoporphyrin IX monomethyl ester cyclase
MSEILLIQPPSPTPNKAHTKGNSLSAPPIALGYLASVLLEAGYTVQIVDMEIQDMGSEEIQKILVAEKPHLVALSTTTLTYKNALRVAAIVKEINSNTVTVLGGPHVTFTAEDALSHSEVDFVIRGEGELPLLELSRFVLEGQGSPSKIKGLSARKSNGGLFHNPRPPFICDLDILPFPARYLLPLHLYSVPGLIITGRGCEGRCKFCAARGVSGGRYRMRSVDNVIREIETMISALGLTFFFFGDDTFTVIPERTQDFCRTLQKRNLNISWMCETRVDKVDQITLQAMAKAGCKILQFGAESGSQKILDSIGKGITLEQLRWAVQTSLECGMLPTCSFMVPHPDDTWETVEETKAFIQELQALGVRTAISLTTPFPGTYLATHLEDLGLTLICDDTDKYNFSNPVIETKAFNVWEIREMYMDMVLLCLNDNRQLNLHANSAAQVPMA